MRKVMLAISIIALVISFNSQAQSYPNQPIRLVIPFAAGGPSDVLARGFSQKLGESLGQPIIIDNKPGAGTNLAAEFVAVTQVLVYIGAVMVLFLFGTMLTRSRIGRDSGLNNTYWKLGIPVALVLFAAMAVALVNSFGDERMPTDDNIVSTQQVSDQIFGPYLLPFWALSFVLLAAVIGAIVLARKD